jgi:hypothetical protein
MNKEIIKNRIIEIKSKNKDANIDDINFNK